MRITRRGFIRNLGMAAVAAVSLGSAGRVFGQISKTRGYILLPESFSDPLSYLTSEHFKPFVNTVVRLDTGENRFVRLQLMEVKELALEANTKRGFIGESFSLSFQGSPKLKLSQETYTLEHDVLGRFSLFLVPVGLKGIRYEAIINRIGR